MEPGKTNRIERRKEATRKKIIAAAIDLFKEQGFDQTTVEQIAEKADVALGTIYNHFPAKEAIICEHVQRMISEQGPGVLSLVRQLPDTRSRLTLALRKSLEWMHIELNNDIYEKYLTYRLQRLVDNFKDRDPGLSSGFKNVLEPILELGKEMGEIRRDVPSQVLAGQLEVAHIITAVVWVTNAELFSIDESIDMNVDLFLKGAESRESISRL